MKSDCFGYKKGRCAVLEKKKGFEDCYGCPFYKTVEENALGRKESIDRILKLDSEIRDKIIIKYYGGNYKLLLGGN